MALIPCSECGTEISTEAKACPKCGASVPKSRSWIKWVIGVPVVLFVLAGIFGESNDDRQARWTAARSECSDKAAKAAIPTGSRSFSRADEAVGVKALEDCMASRGFKVQLR